jgi:hypothetical protein
MTFVQLTNLNKNFCLFLMQTMSFKSYYTYHSTPVILKEQPSPTTGKIGLIELGGTFKKPAKHVHKVYIDDTLVECPHALADAQITALLAPQAQIYAYIAQNTFDGLYRALHRAIEENCVAIVLGWAAPESPSEMKRFDGLFREARQANIYIFAAMGPEISFPASRPCVYGCGVDVKSDYEQILSYSGTSAIAPVWAAFISRLSRDDRRRLRHSITEGDAPGQIVIEKSMPAPISTKIVYFKVEGAQWGKAPLKVQFQDCSLPPTRQRIWSFGDNTTSTAQHPVHMYKRAGCYDVKLKNENGEYIKKYLIRVK